MKCCRLKEMAAAWVIEWEWEGDHRALNDSPVYILPWRWSEDRVLSFLRAIYYNNSELFEADYGLHELSHPKRYERLEIFEARRIFFGHNPYLVCAYAKDFSCTMDDDGKTEILSWTRPSGGQRIPGTVRTRTVGCDMKRTVRRIRK